VCVCVCVYVCVCVIYIHIHIHIYIYTYTYMYIYISNLLLLLFILVSSLCSAFLYIIHIYIYIYYILINVSLIRNRRQELRVADETTIHCQVPSSCNYNYTLQYIVLHHYYDRIRIWRIIRDVLPGMTTDVTLKYRRCIQTYFASSRSPMVIAYARTRAYARVYVRQFTLHVGLLHVPKCFAVCCSPC